jgi:LacI family transcriptional regulator
MRIFSLNLRRGMSEERKNLQAPQKIAVLVDTSTSWGRNVIEGIHSYQKLHNRWHLYVEPRGLDQKLWLPPGWNGQGVIARVGYRELSRQLKQSGLPVVNVSGIRIPGAKFPRITTNLRKNATIAAEHFLNNGFRNFAYFSLISLDYVSEHQMAFNQAVTNRGFTCRFFESGTEEGKGDSEWTMDQKKLLAWLESLPKPVGILTWTSNAARELIYACLDAGHRIPEQIAVMSGSDDELFCKVAPVPISAVHVAAEEIGFLAAQRLDEMLMGKQAGRSRDLQVPPLGVVVRQSTEVLAVDDASLAKALRFIRNDPAQKMSVDDVAAQAGYCRRLLEQRFAKILGRSPAAEIKRVRVELALQLLQTTNMRISDVAEKSGFSTAEYMATVFRKEFGVAPLSFRRNKPHES